MLFYYICAKYFSWNESNRFQYGPKMHFISETGERTYLEQTDGNYISPRKIRNKGMMVDYKTRTDFQDVALKVKEAQKDNLINDLVGHLPPEWTMDKKLQWVLDNKAVPVMSRQSMGHHSGSADKKPARLDAWQNVYLKYQPPATNYADKEGEKARPLYPTANAILKKYEEVVPIANYSILVKDSIIHRHTGPENRRGEHLRVHIPLHILLHVILHMLLHMLLH